MPALHSPAAERNKDPILEILRTTLPASGTVLEIASGTGQHVAHFAAALPQLHWQPSDLEPLHVNSVTAYSHGLANVATPVILDVTRTNWPIESADAMLCSNMIHIAPPEVTTGLLDGAGRPALSYFLLRLP